MNRKMTIMCVQAIRLFSNKLFYCKGSAFKLCTFSFFGMESMDGVNFNIKITVGLKLNNPIIHNFALIGIYSVDFTSYLNYFREPVPCDSIRKVS